MNKAPVDRFGYHGAMKMIVTVLIAVALGFAAIVLLAPETETQQNVLSESTSSLPSPSIIPTLLPTPTPTPRPIMPTPTPKPTPTPVPPQEIHGFIERYANEYHVDPNLLRHIAVCESGFNPSAVNGPYVGLYQFKATTWRNNRAFMGEDSDPSLRLNAEESVQTAAYLVSIGRVEVWPHCYPR